MACSGSCIVLSEAVATLLHKAGLMEQRHSDIDLVIQTCNFVLSKLQSNPESQLRVSLLVAQFVRSKSINISTIPSAFEALWLVAVIAAKYLVQAPLLQFDDLTTKDVGAAAVLACDMIDATLSSSKTTTSFLLALRLLQCLAKFFSVPKWTCSKEEGEELLSLIDNSKERLFFGFDICHICMPSMQSVCLEMVHLLIQNHTNFDADIVDILAICRKSICRSDADFACRVYEIFVDAPKCSWRDTQTSDSLRYTAEAKWHMSLVWNTNIFFYSSGDTENGQQWEALSKNLAICLPLDANASVSHHASFQD